MGWFIFGFICGCIFGYWVCRDFYLDIISYNQKDSADSIIQSMRDSVGIYESKYYANSTGSKIPESKELKDV